MNANRCDYFPLGEIQSHADAPTFILDAIIRNSYSLAICKKTKLVMSYWRKSAASTSLLPTSSADIASQQSWRHYIRSGPSIFTRQVNENLEDVKIYVFVDREASIYLFHVSVSI